MLLSLIVVTFLLLFLLIFLVLFVLGSIPLFYHSPLSLSLFLFCVLLLVCLGFGIRLLVGCYYSCVSPVPYTMHSSFSFHILYNDVFDGSLILYLYVNLMLPIFHITTWSHYCRLCAAQHSTTQHSTVQCIIAQCYLHLLSKTHLKCDCTRSKVMCESRRILSVWLYVVNTKVPSAHFLNVKKHFCVYDR